MGPDPEGKESLPSDKKIKVVPALKTFFEGKIPWRRGHHSGLQENARAVQLRQENTHAPDKLKKKVIDISEIDAIIGGYLEKGYIEPVPKAEEE
jgi:hypothetical protein